MRYRKASYRSVFIFAHALPCASGFLGGFSEPAVAQAAAERGTLSVLFENDYFFHSDRDYTNGVEFAWTTAPADTPQLRP